MFQTEYPFTLKKGYIDEEGNLHREGVMRLATAADEIMPLKDTRVVNNPSYLFILLLSRVIVRLGSLREVTPKMVEGFFTEDVAYLYGFYNEINGGLLSGLGESSATPRN